MAKIFGISFEDALNSVSIQMGMTPVELIEYAAQLRNETPSIELEPTDEYIDRAIEYVTSGSCSLDLDGLLREIKKA